LNYKFKLNTIITISFFILLFTIISALLIQYELSKNIIIDNYTNKYYNKTLQIKEDFSLILNKAQYNFKKNEQQNIRKLNQFYEIYKHSNGDFDIDEVVEILNKDIPFGEYQVFLINKNKIIEKSSYKKDIGLDLSKFKLISELFQSIFNKKISTNISVPILDRLSMSLKEYTIRLSPDENYILQVAFVIDFKEILDKTYFKDLDFTDDINIYMATEYSFQKIVQKSNEAKNQSLKNNLNETKIFFTNINKYLQNKNIEKIINSNIKEESINFNDELTQLFALNKDNLLYFKDFDDTKLHFYSISNSLFNETNELQIIINLNYPMADLKHDIDKSFKYFIITVSIVLFILIIIYFFIVFNISQKLIYLVDKINKNKLANEDGLIVTEIYNLKKSYNKLHYNLNNQIIMNKKLLYIDTLTKSKNRKAYDKKILKLLSNFNRYKTVFSIAILDIDNFKYINDTYGHRVGDNVLIDMVRLIKSTIRNNDYLFRVGGEEFVLLYEHTTLKNSKTISEKIRSIIQKDLNTVDQELITVSIGLTEVKINDTEDSIYKRADELLYKSKNNGKNTLSY